jgi:hypothetical protein
LIAGGEKDVDNLRALGFVATCNHGGEGKWWPSLSEWFKGRRVFLLCDNDEQGEKHQAVVGEALKEIADEIKVVRFAGLPVGGDVSDLIDQRLKDGLDTRAIYNELDECFRDAPTRESETVQPDNSAPALEPEPSWPFMDEAAYHGIAGEVVKTIEPHSEADPVATLIQFLTAVGNILGRKFYFRVERDRHHPNLFIVLVGASSKGRKGTSWGWVRSIVTAADKCWAVAKVKGGLSSGEGFIHEVRDPVKKWNVKEQSEEIVDPGVTDKRLLVIEPEFASALAVMERHGNTLSSLVRKAWDGDKLATLTRNSPLTATDAHVSAIGHITEAELKARLTSTDAANGFANRFLFPLVKRSKLLPFGGDINDEVIDALGKRLEEVLWKDLPQFPLRIEMTDDAAAAWRQAYERLSAANPGLFGAVRARAEAQTLRLAMIYALLDGKRKIDVDHLAAGMAVWEYCEESAAIIFGKASGDAVADEILRALKQAGKDGLTRTVIRDLFGRNQSASRIETALGSLLSQGLVRSESKPSGGRPLETWYARDEATTKTT